MQTAFYECSNQSFLESVGVKALSIIDSADFVLEDALPGQNKTNAEHALRALINYHGKAPNTAAAKAIYNRAIGWIGFIWGEPGKEPPEFATLEEFQAWWNKDGNRKELFSGGWGLSHIIAKRDWEGKHIAELEGQTGKNFVLTTLPVMLSKMTIPTYAKNNDRITIKQGITSITIDKVRNIAPQSIPYQRIEPELPHKVLSSEFWVLTGFTLLGKQYADATLMLPKEKGLPSEENSPGKIVESVDGSVASVARPNLFTGAPCKSVTRDRENSRDCDPAFVKDQPPMTQGLSGATAKHLPTSIVLSDRSYAAGATDSIEETVPQDCHENNGSLAGNTARIESAGESLAAGAHPSLPTKDTVHQHSSWSQANLRGCDPAFVKDRSPMAKAYQGSPPEHSIQHAISERSCVLGATDSIKETVPQDSLKSNAILERAAPKSMLLERKRLEVANAKTWDDIYNIFVDAFAPKRETPLYDRLVAGEFNTLPWRSFVAMIERITLEENIAFPEMYDAICNYLTENEPLGGYNIDALTA